MLYGIIITWTNDGVKAHVRSTMTFNNKEDAESYAEMFNQYAGRGTDRRARVVPCNN